MPNKKQKGGAFAPPFPWRTKNAQPSKKRTKLCAFPLILLAFGGGVWYNNYIKYSM